MNHKEQIKTLKEQLDISHQLHHEEFIKVRRYEKTLSALLNIVADQEQDELIHIITDTLLGHELDEKYENDALEGINILSQFITD